MVRNKSKIKEAKIEYLNNALLIDNILVISDLHIGFEETLGQGIVRIHVKEMIEKLKDTFSYLEKNNKETKRVVICGDLKHEFGKISGAEWRDTLKVLDFLLDWVGEVILIRGNHDTILGPIAKKRNVKLKDYYRYKNCLFIHGDKIDESGGNFGVIIMGHLHPSIVLSDEYKSEKYKCFLRGYLRVGGKKKKIIILPSFSNIVLGYEVGEEHKGDRKFMFFSEKKLKNFNVLIYNDKEKRVYDFGKLKKLFN